MARWASILTRSLLVLCVAACSEAEPSSSEPQTSSPPGTSPSEGSVTKPELPAPISAETADAVSLSSVETARIELDSPDWMVFAAGALWVRLDNGNVVKVDPTKARVEDQIPSQGDGAFSTCQGFGTSGDSIWSCSPFGPLERISTSTSEITENLEAEPFRNQGHLVVASQSLWLINSTSAESMVGVSLKDNTLGAPIPFGVACGDLAAADPIVWAVCPWDNQVLRIDTSSGEVTGRLQLNSPRQLAVGDDVWVAFKGGVAQINPESLTVEAVYDLEPGCGGSFAINEKSVWIRCEGKLFLVGIDLDRQRVFSVITVDDLPSGGNVVEIQGQLWATAFDDAALVRLRPPTD